MIFKRASSRNLLHTRSHLHGMIKDTWYTRAKTYDLGDIVLKGSFSYIMRSYTMRSWLKERGQEDWLLIYIVRELSVCIQWKIKTGE